MVSVKHFLCPYPFPSSGEVLDVDGVTGGYNFQSAWTAGWLAGHSAAVSLIAETQGAKEAAVETETKQNSSIRK
jgi:hypothetical protein